MRFAIVQHDIVWEDKAANHAAVDRLLRDAALPSRTFIVLPELGDTGFSFNLDRIVDDRTLTWARATAKRHDVFIQAGHAQRGSDGRGRNCATIVSPDGRTLATYAKLHPFSYSREVDHFTGGDGIDLVNVQGVTVCPMICYDLRFPEAWRIAAREGAEVFTIGASWPVARQSHWRALAIARALDTQAFVVAVNRVGRDPNLAYAGGSLIVSPKGEVLVEAGDQPCVVSFDLDLESARAWRRDFPMFADTRRGALGTLPIRRTSA
jgi:omega-amidase